MQRLTLLIALQALAFGLVACQSKEPASSPGPKEPTASAEPPATDAFRTALSRDGNYSLGWRPVGRADVPINEYFELEACLAPADDPEARITDAKLVVSAWMPGHGHGMVTKPASDPVGDCYLVKGMLFHMGGHWQLFFDVLRGGGAERVEFDLEL